MAAHWDLPAAFSEWLKASCTFCNTLVDRIVSGYPENAVEIQQELGYTDHLLTEGEQFHLWVIEDNPAVREAFPADRAGVEVVFAKDIQPYRLRKVRILNGAHTAMVPLAYLYGLRTVRESVEDDTIGNFIRNLVFEEIIPALDMPEAALRRFAEDVLDRFRNPYIHHLLISISLNATAKFATRVLPSLLEYQNRKGELPPRMVMAFAAQILFYRGQTLDGENIALNDDEGTLGFFRDAWERFGEDIPALTKHILGEQAYWGSDLNEIPLLTATLTENIENILHQPLKDVLAGI